MATSMVSWTCQTGSCCRFLFRRKVLTCHIVNHTRSKPKELHLDTIKPVDGKSYTNYESQAHNNQILADAEMGLVGEQVTERVDHVCYGIDAADDLQTDRYVIERIQS